MRKRLWLLPLGLMTLFSPLFALHYTEYRHPHISVEAQNTALFRSLRDQRGLLATKLSFGTLLTFRQNGQRAKALFILPSTQSSQFYASFQAISALVQRVQKSKKRPPSLGIFLPTKNSVLPAELASLPEKALREAPKLFIFLDLSSQSPSSLTLSWGINKKLALSQTRSWVKECPHCTIKNLWPSVLLSPWKDFSSPMLIVQSKNVSPRKTISTNELASYLLQASSHSLARPEREKRIYSFAFLGDHALRFALTEHFYVLLTFIALVGFLLLLVFTGFPVWHTYGHLLLSRGAQLALYVLLFGTIIFVSNALAVIFVPRQPLPLNQSIILRATAQGALSLVFGMPLFLLFRLKRHFHSDTLTIFYVQIFTALVGLYLTVLSLAWAPFFLLILGIEHVAYTLSVRELPALPGTLIFFVCLLLFFSFMLAIGQVITEPRVHIDPIATSALLLPLLPSGSLLHFHSRTESKGQWYVPVALTIASLVYLVFLPWLITPLVLSTEQRLIPRSLTLTQSQAPFSATLKVTPRVGTKAMAVSIGEGKRTLTIPRGRSSAQVSSKVFTPPPLGMSLTPVLGGQQVTLTLSKPLPPELMISLRSSKLVSLSGLSQSQAQLSIDHLGRSTLTANLTPQSTSLSFIVFSSAQTTLRVKRQLYSCPQMRITSALETPIKKIRCYDTHRFFLPGSVDDGGTLAAQEAK